jgi:lysine 6-dehydrogenase
MKIFVLGGTGRFGQLTTRLLARHDLVSGLVIGARHLDAAQRVATELGDKATAVHIDATQEERLTSLVAECDLLLNTSGPYTQTLLPAIRAAMRSRTHYCDLLEDGQDAEKVLALDAQAQTAGITALIGIGVFPGLTNLLAKHAAAQLEQVEELRVCIVLTIREPRQRLAAMRASGRISASWESMLAAASGSPRIYREGHWVDLEALPTGVEVEMPPGRSVTAYPIRLSEAITLPRYLPGVRTVSTLFSLLPPRADALFRAQAQRITAGELEASQAVLSLFEALAAEPDEALALPQGAPLVPIWVEALGLKAGRRAHYACWPTGSWASTEAILATAALKLLRGEIRARGVVPPEAIFEPIPFFTEVAHWGAQELGAGEVLAESLQWRN